MNEARSSTEATDVVVQTGPTEVLELYRDKETRVTIIAERVEAPVALDSAQDTQTAEIIDLRPSHRVEVEAPTLDGVPLDLPENINPATPAQFFDPHQKEAA